MNLLIVKPDADSIPLGTEDLVRQIGWTPITVPDYDGACRKVEEHTIDAVIVPEPRASHDASHQPSYDVPDRALQGTPNQTPQGSLQGKGNGEDNGKGSLAHLMELVVHQHLATIIISDEPNHAALTIPSLATSVRRDVELAELRGQLTMIQRYHGFVKNLEKELKQTEKLSCRLTDHFKELDEELCLTSTLQRAMLPDIERLTGGAIFRAFYRPASWVAGDIYGVFPIDSDRTAFYLADVVGHGLASGLLTVFVKHTLEPQSNVVDRLAYTDPSWVLKLLNDSLVKLGLPSGQFLTICYAVFNRLDSTLKYSRGGHPYPMLVRRNGSIDHLECDGGLVGIGDKETFESADVQLELADKILFYSDGVELGLQTRSCRGNPRSILNDLVRQSADLSLDAIITHLVQFFSQDSHDDIGPTGPRDDVTILGMEVTSG